jgi:NADH:ubiquinone oxidoreductase subunit E
MNAQRVNEIIDGYDVDRSASLAILQDIQREYNFLPREALELVAQRLDVPVGHVYQMATFFKAFSLKPRGDYLIKVCLGTACHVQGGPHILGELEHHLKIKAGQTTSDGKFSVEGVRLGADRRGQRRGLREDVDRGCGQTGQRPESGRGQG